MKGHLPGNLLFVFGDNRTEPEPLDLTVEVFFAVNQVTRGPSSTFVLKD
jgi:hypothetical protein